MNQGAHIRACDSTHSRSEGTACVVPLIDRPALGALIRALSGRIVVPGRTRLPEKGYAFGDRDDEIMVYHDGELLCQIEDANVYLPLFLTGANDGPIPPSFEPALRAYVRRVVQPQLREANWWVGDEMGLTKAGWLWWPVGLLEDDFDAMVGHVEWLTDFESAKAAPVRRVEDWVAQTGWRLN